MIQIKDKVNKTQLFKELTEIGMNRFKDTCEPEEDLKCFLDGAQQLFKLLRLHGVSKSVNCDHPRSERSYIGQNLLRCNKCGEEFS